MKMRKGGGLRKGLGNNKSRMAENQECVCPQCGFTLPHITGHPCRNESCPYCHIPLSRNIRFQGKESQKTITEAKPTASPILKKKESITPEIDPDICIGCGSCVDVCPVEAISIMNGKAVIDSSKCLHCRSCVRACPMGAIH